MRKLSSIKRFSRSRWTTNKNFDRIKSSEFIKLIIKQPAILKNSLFTMPRKLTCFCSCFLIFCIIRWRNVIHYCWCFHFDVYVKVLNPIFINYLINFGWDWLPCANSFTNCFNYSLLSWFSCPINSKYVKMIWSSINYPFN